MKPKKKISGRERWILAALPAVLIFGAYFLCIVSDLYAELDKAQKRVVAANAPIPPLKPSATLAQAKTTQASVKRSIADHETRIAELEEKVAVLPKNGVIADENYNPTHMIEQMESVFERNGITALISEAVGDGAGGSTGNQAPASLVSVLTSKTTGEAGTQRGARVWHCIFNDQTARFEHALKELEQKVPGFVPLSMNLVYNPDNDGETRLLELWMLY